jgi:non-ribosomal peptide synthetase component F
MKVMGISGLENAVPFKHATWPGLDEREYRITQGMDAAAALVVDGKLVAAAMGRTDTLIVAMLAISKNVASRIGGH